MSKLLKRIAPFAATWAWRNRSKISSWFRNRNSKTPSRSTSGAPVGTGV